MFNNYTDKIKYISCKGEKDSFGFSTNAEPKDIYVRYIGGKTALVTESNTYRTENRLLYLCPFEVAVGDKFIVKDRELKVKYVEEVQDVFGKTVYWEVEVL